MRVFPVFQRAFRLANLQLVACGIDQRAGFDESRTIESVATVSAGVRLLDTWLEDPAGERVASVEQGVPIRLRALLEAEREIPDPLFGFVIASAQDVNVHEFLTELPDAGSLRAGERVTVEASVENQLSPGRYYLHLGVARNGNRGDAALYAPHALGFVVFGDQESAGIVGAGHEMRVVPTSAGGR